MIMASALVLLMTPGLGFFYGGMVRVKNVISTVRSRRGINGEEEEEKNQEYITPVLTCFWWCGGPHLPAFLPVYAK